MDPATPILIELEQYDEIRDLLGSISDDILTDAIIERTSFLLKAEAMVRQRITNWADILAGGNGASQDDLVFLQTAVIAYTAYLLVPKVQRLIRSENIVDYSYTALTMADWDLKRAELLQEYNDSISRIANDAVVVSPIFMVTGPTRSQPPMPAPDTSIQTSTSTTAIP